ncbi:MAG: hypothetical protein JW850_21030 [Thermoflexales bacterium]|nr:hypothetical protein [Thermoflexales bacterium]
MNTINRIIVVLAILLTIIILTLLLILPQETLTTFGQTAKNLAEQIGSIPQPGYLVLRACLILVAVAVNFALVVLLLTEFRGSGRRWIRVPSVSGGQVSMRVDSIADRLKFHIDPLPDVLTVKPRVSGRRNGVAVSLEIETASEINVPHKAEEVLEVARDVIQNKLGLKLAGKPEVMIRTVYPSDSARPVATPASRPTLPVEAPPARLGEPGPTDSSQAQNE